MGGEISTLVRNNLGLYDLQITAPDGRPILEVRNISFERAIAMIERREKEESK